MLIDPVAEPVYTSDLYRERGAMETAKLFRNGRSQAVRLPKEFRFEGDRVYIKRVGNAVVLLPYDNTWQPLFESLDEFSDDFMAERVQPPQQEREYPFD
jgi:antitoxin VapB